MEDGDIADLDAILGNGNSSTGTAGYIEYTAGSDGLFGATGVTRRRKKGSRRGKMTKMSVLFLASSAVQVGIVLWLGVSPWWKKEGGAGSTTGTDVAGIYALLVVLSGFAGGYFALDGVWSENKVAVWASEAAVLLASFLVAYDVNSRRVGSKIPGMLFVLVLLQLANLVLAFVVNRSFGWRTYRRVGADGRLSKAYKVYQTLVTLLKLDAFSQAALMIAGGWWFITGPLPTTALRSWAEAIAVGAAMAWGFAGWRSVRAESSQAVVIWALAGMVEPVYVTYKFWEWHAHPLVGPSHAYVIAFSAVAVEATVVRVAALVWGLRARSNFGLGLKAAWAVNKKGSSQPDDDPYRYGVDDDLDDEDLTGEGDYLIWGGVEPLT